ncbi:MAG: laccase domain-containing protein [Patescibacteria group bacterium]
MQLQDFQNLIWGISGKEDGKMKLDTEIAFENRKNFFNKIGIDFEDTVSAGLVHGNRIETVDEDSERIIKEVDGLITNNKNLFLTIAIIFCLAGGTAWAAIIDLFGLDK